MTKTLILVALIPLAFGSAPTSAARALTPTRPPQCEIRATPNPGGLRLEGVVRGTSGLLGSYRFILDADGADGVSKVGQGGKFIIGSSGKTVVAVTELSIGNGATYRGNMVVSSPAGEAKCTDVSPSQVAFPRTRT